MPLVPAPQLNAEAAEGFLLAPVEDFHIDLDRLGVHAPSNEHFATPVFPQLCVVLRVYWKTNHCYPCVFSNVCGGVAMRTSALRQGPLGRGVPPQGPCPRLTSHDARENSCPAAGRFLIANPRLEFRLTYGKISLLRIPNRERMAIFQAAPFRAGAKKGDGRKAPVEGRTSAGAGLLHESPAANSNLRFRD